MCVLIGDLPQPRSAASVRGLVMQATSKCPASTMEPSELDHAQTHCLCDRIGAADGLELIEK